VLFKDPQGQGGAPSITISNFDGNQGTYYDPQDSAGAFVGPVPPEFAHDPDLYYAIQLSNQPAESKVIPLHAAEPVVKPNS